MTTAADNDTSTGSVPLIPLTRRRNYSPLGSDHGGDAFDGADTAYHGGHHASPHDDAHDDALYHSPPSHTAFGSMARGGQQPLFAALRPRKGSTKSAVSVVSSYVFDWIIIFAILGVAYYLNDKDPNRRPFSLEDPNISFPFTENETVPSWLLVLLNCGVPVVVILVISILLVPGHTVPRGTPQSLIWKRKLWELHVGWLGLALSLSSVWFITNGMKNMFGKPRPDALARCNPDLENWTKYIVGGSNVGSNGGYNRLVSADICQGMANHEDAAHLLEDGFRSYPSGHSSSAAAGLIYLSLFIASKFAITFPFLAPGNHTLAPTSFSAFPSRRPQQQPAHIPLTPNHNNNINSGSPNRHLGPHPNDPSATHLFTAHNASLASARRQAAAPPLYLLIFATAPFFTAVFIAASRWFDFRHHGFDILFGFLMGTICAVFAFRWYHLPVSQGAGWAWGPRCADKAWWAGVGSFSYAMDWEEDIDLSSAAAVGAMGGREFDEPSAMEEGRRDKMASMASSGSASGNGGRDDFGIEGDHEARRRAL